MSRLEGVRSSGSRCARALLAAALALVAARTPSLLAEAFAVAIEGEIWQQLPAWGVGYCTWNPRPDILQCPAGTARPPDGALLFPIAIAGDRGNVYVTDQGNNRVQGFDASGNPITFPYPIGDGQPGAGQVTTSDGTYERLNQPEGIAIDHDPSPSGHKILVGDSLNNRVAVFRTSGQLAFAVTIPDTRSTVPVSINPTGVAVAPGTVVYDPANVPPDADLSGRVVVTDKYHSYVFILDAAFGVLAQLGTGSEEFDDALHPNNAAKGFAAPAGVSIDDAGHVFIADYDNQRIVVYDLQGHYLGKFGQPPDRFSVPEGTLLGPLGVSIDRSAPPQHHGRVVVADADNQRVLVYTVAFAPDPLHPGREMLTSATYQFFINGAGDLDGFPQTAIIDAFSDPVGRLYVVDTINFRVQRFEVPDLAVVEGLASGGSGRFSIVVPIGKDASGVRTVTPVFDCPPHVLGGACPQPTSNIATIYDVNPPSVASIAPGDIVNFTFNYTVVDPSQPVSITIGATGDPNPTTGAVSSNALVIVPTMPCTDCVTVRHIIDTVTHTDAVPQGAWYPNPIVIRLTASSPTGQLAKVAYGFTSGSLAADVGFFTKTVAELGGDRFSASVDVPVAREESISDWDNWAIAADGSTESHHPTKIGLDLVKPSISIRFDQRLPAANIAVVAPVTGVAGVDPWYRGVTPATPLRVPVEFGDGVSGVASQSPAPDATDNKSYIVFSGEGRNQWRTVSATDNAGHTTSGRSDDPHFGGRPVNVDNTAPVLTLPANRALNTIGTAAVPIPGNAPPFLASATDFLGDGVTPGSGVQSITNPPPGVTFPAGVTWWTFVATDNVGNASRGTRAVSVSVTQEAKGLSGAPVVYTTTGVSSAPTVTCGSPSGATFPVGVTTVTCAAADAASGLNDTQTFTVTVVDTTPPTIDRHADVIAEATGPGGALVAYTPPATHDIVDPIGAATCAPAPNALFALGSTTVTCAAKDAHGNAAAPTAFTVTVVDTTPPTIAVPNNMTVGATSAKGATVAFTATSADLVDGTRPAVCSPASGSTFAIGTTTVTCGATDAHGNAAAPRSFTVTVLKEAPKIVSASLTPGTLWPPNHKLVTVTATIDALDPGGLPLKVTLVSISSSEPDSGLGDGDTANDIQGAAYGTDDRVFQLRAERSGRGPGRTYTVRYDVTNEAGLTTRVTLRALVPHDLGAR